MYLDGWWWPIMVQIVAIVLAIGVGEIVNYATEGKQKRYIKSAFKQYLSGDVIEQIMSDPGALKLGGEKRELNESRLIIGEVEPLFQEGDQHVVHDRDEAPHEEQQRYGRERRDRVIAGGLLSLPRWLGGRLRHNRGILTLVDFRSQRAGLFATAGTRAKGL